MTSSNSLRFGQDPQHFGDDATLPWKKHVPMGPPDEIKEPAIRGQTTHKLNNLQMELAPHERKLNYDPFILQKPRKKDKRKTCQTKAQWNLKKSETLTFP